jgi:hypothetical protein
MSKMGAVAYQPTTIDRGRMMLATSGAACVVASADLRPLRQVTADTLDYHDICSFRGPFQLIGVCMGKRKLWVFLVVNTRHVDIAVRLKRVHIHNCIVSLDVNEHKRGCGWADEGKVNHKVSLLPYSACPKLAVNSEQ